MPISLDEFKKASGDLEKSTAQKIRDYVQENYMEPARKRGVDDATIRAGDVHDGMGLHNSQPLVCDTLRGKKIQRQCNIKLIKERRGENVTQKHAPNIWYTYQLL